jgi:hypothetical protein
MDNRSEDSFYNDAGTIVVSILGEIGKEGQSGDAHSVTYLHFQPGLPEKTIISFGPIRSCTNDYVRAVAVFQYKIPALRQNGKEANTTMERVAPLPAIIMTGLFFLSPSTLSAPRTTR